MKKITSLRGILPLLLAVWGMLSASAQTVVFEEDFSSVKSGDNVTTDGSSSPWTKNSNFSAANTVYQAGGAIKIGKSKGTGYVTTIALDLSANDGAYTVSFDVKGWTSVEGKIIVTPSSGASQTITYTNKMADGFVTKTIDFTGGTASTTIKIATSAKRAFIDNIKITQETGGTSIPVVSTPIISPLGGNVAEGTEVTISCATDDATIYYALNAANPETVTGTAYTAPITLTENCTLTAWAEKSDMEASARVTETFKVYPEVAYKKANAIISGQKYILYANGKVAQPIVSKNYDYVQTETATENAGVVSQLGTLNAFTFTEVSGGYTIQDEAGKYYYQKTGYQNFNVSTTAPSDGSHIWSVERQADGTFLITNTVFDQYWQYTTHKTYGAYTEEQTSAVLPTLYTSGDPGVAEIKEVQELAFSASEAYNVLGEPFTAPTLSGAKTAVTYDSSNPAVATVDAAGVVTVVGIGATVITASAEGTDEYYSAMAEYRLVVSEPGVIWAEDFSSNDLSGYGIEGSNTKIYVDDNYAGGTAPEILIGNTSGAMEVNIGDLQGLHGRFLLTFKSNKGISAITTTTEGVKIGKINFTQPNGSCEITVPRGVTTLNLKFKNTNKSSNTRVDDFKLVHAGYTLPISQYGYSTFASPRAYEVPAGLEGAIVTVEGNVANTEFVYTEGDIVPAGIGLLYKGTASTSYTINVTSETATEVYADNCMKGFLQDAPLAVAADTKAYIFANDSEDGLGFYLQGDGSVLNLSYGKAYLSIPATLASQLKGFRLNLGEATGISGVTTQEAATGVYTLSGVRVGNTLNGLPGGVYIVGGKKVIVK